MNAPLPASTTGCSAAYPEAVTDAASGNAEIDSSPRDRSPSRMMIHQVTLGMNLGTGHRGARLHARSARVADPFDGFRHG
jgi:hypothetical protein